MPRGKSDVYQHLGAQEGSCCWYDDTVSGVMSVVVGDTLPLNVGGRDSVCFVERLTRDTRLLAQRLRSDLEPLPRFTLSRPGPSAMPPNFALLPGFLRSPLQSFVFLAAALTTGPRRFVPTVVIRGSHPIRAVGFSPDGGLFAAGSNDRALRVCRTPTEAELSCADQGPFGCIGGGGRGWYVFRCLNR